MSKFNEDEYRDNQLNKHLAEQDVRILSNCCGAELLGDTEICSDCIEHCSPTREDEYLADEYENAMCDKADAERDEGKQ